MTTDQAKLLRDARDKLEVTSEQLAELLGVELVTLNSWLANPTTATGTKAKFYREMPKTARLLLAYRLADPKLRKRRRRK